MKKLCALVVGLAAISLLNVTAAESFDPLAAGFQTPPDSARPHTWWHWMNGNITKEGITADLEAMQRVASAVRKSSMPAKGFLPGR